MAFRHLFWAISASLVLAGRAAMAAEPGFDAARLDEVDRAIAAAIDARRLPGAVYHLERGAARHEQAYGRLDYAADAPAVTRATVFDAASLTKVMATAPAVLLLAEDGRIDLEAPFVRYLPECRGGGRDAVTVRHLLTHSAAFRSGLPRSPDWQGQDAALALACRQTPTDPPGTAFRYSDINYILLGLLVQREAGMPLERFVHARIFAPLGLVDTGYLPLARMPAARIAPTGGVVGVVHDPTARRMGGVAGSAGVFSTAGDVARFARMLLAGGALDGVRILSEHSVRLLTTAQSPPGVTARAMGMDIDSPFATRPRGALFPVGSFGHTGFTGCILWIDPQSRSFYVFLSNRVHPDERSDILPLYSRLGTLSARAVLEAHQ